MDVTRGDVEARKAELEVHRAKVMASLNVIDGAIQQCEWFLEKMGEEAEAPTFEKVEA